MASAHTKPMKGIQRTGKLRGWLDSIRSTNGGLLRSVNVVEAASDPESIGHRYFTWDDTKAAAKYRIVEAERLIRRVYVIDGTDGQKQPAFLSLLPDREKPGGGYRATSDVVSSKALRAQLELTAKAELRAWTERYQMLTALVGQVAEAAGIAPPKRRRRTAK